MQTRTLTVEVVGTQLTLKREGQQTRLQLTRKACSLRSALDRAGGVAPVAGG